MSRTLTLIALLLAGCASADPPAAAPAPASASAPARAPELPPGLRWFRASAEQRAVYLQTYRAAAERLRDTARAHPAGGWAVILDADETVLDNSLFQKRLAESGAAYSEAIWNDWVREEAAPPLPGAVEFVRLVRRLGGRVVIVTNREEVVCAETRRNLERVGVAAEAVLCRPPGPSDKNPRFRAVQEGRVPGLPALQVVMWVGDNIQDFPAMVQREMRAAPEARFEPFGRVFWVLPNPMYGSWEGNPVP